MSGQGHHMVIAYMFILMNIGLYHLLNLYVLQLIQNKPQNSVDPNEKIMVAFLYLFALFRNLFYLV